MLIMTLSLTACSAEKRQFSMAESYIPIIEAQSQTEVVSSDEEFSKVSTSSSESESVNVSASPKNIKTQYDEEFFAMDTYVKFTAYGDSTQFALESAKQRFFELESLWSVTDENSDIYAINHANGDPTAISTQTADLISYALQMAKETKTFEPIITEKDIKRDLEKNTFYMLNPECIEKTRYMLSQYIEEIRINNTTVKATFRVAFTLLNGFTAYYTHTAEISGKTLIEEYSRLGVDSWLYRYINALNASCSPQRIDVLEYAIKHSLCGQRFSALPFDFDCKSIGKEDS